VVTFTGRVPHAEVERYYSVVDIAPFPRRPLAVCEMVSPLKPFEAMAMAKAVVVSSVAALTEIVTDGENGLVHTKGDVASLTAALRRLLDDPDLRERIAQGGLEWVRAERDWTALAGRVDQIYTDVLAARSARG
jgi:glycosyltransferase involved in cell wall biosynthesis